jgi:hypothetical protein
MFLLDDILHYIGGRDSDERGFADSQITNALLHILHIKTIAEPPLSYLSAILWVTQRNTRLTTTCAALIPETASTRRRRRLNEFGRRCKRRPSALASIRQFGYVSPPAPNPAGTIFVELTVKYGT